MIKMVNFKLEFKMPHLQILGCEMVEENITAIRFKCTWCHTFYKICKCR